MKKMIIFILLTGLSMILFSQTKATVKMLNGDEIPCDIITDAINIITDYGELCFRTEFIKEIQFPEPGKGTTLLKTLFGELFRGFITNDTIELSVYGKQMVIRKAKINRIEFNNPLQKAEDYTVTVSLRNGDGFFGNMVGETMIIQTSYGEVDLPFDNMVQIAFEGFGNVLSKIEMKDGGIVQGIIKNEYLPLTLLTDIELEVVPDLMKQVGFYQEELMVQETVQGKDGEIEVFSVASVFSSPKKEEIEEMKEVVKTPLGSEMVLVKSGSFWMGNSRNDSEGHYNEEPVHITQITYDFYIGKYETTFVEYDYFCDEYNSSFKGNWLEKPDDNGFGRTEKPVINISWMDVTKYCNWLSEKEGIPKAYDNNGKLLDQNGALTNDISKVKGYRLPTEAEWEYAARGGHKSTQDYLYAGGLVLDKVGWYSKNSKGILQEVGKKSSNDLGLYDMSGNVSEYCYDYCKVDMWEHYVKNRYNKVLTVNPVIIENYEYHIVRGGSWSNGKEKDCRISSRSYAQPFTKRNSVGFRIVRNSQ